MEDKFPTTRTRKAIKEIQKEFGKINLMLFMVGLVLLILGYIFMNFVDSTASNVMGFVAPIMIIFSILIIIFSLLIDPNK